jgi:hypothetical protein
MRAVVVVFLLGTLFLYPLLAPPPHRIDEAHFQLITEGMTEAEVQAIFGVPAGSYDWARPKPELIWLTALVEAQHLELQDFARQVGRHKLTVRLVDAPVPVQATKNWISRRGAFIVSLNKRPCCRQMERRPDAHRVPVVRLVAEADRQVKARGAAAQLARAFTARYHAGMARQSFARHVREAREAAGMSQIALGRLAGIKRESQRSIQIRESRCIESVSRWQ